jgi:hypothetical protein
VVIIIHEHREKCCGTSLRRLRVLKAKGQLESLVRGDLRCGHRIGIKPLERQGPGGLDP